MARPKAKKNDVATPERLLDAAEAVFSDVGFTDARLEDIAKRAGIRRPSLLYHFPSKQVLYTEIVKRTFSRLRDALMPTMNQGGGFAERVEGMADTFGRFLEAHPNLAPILLRELLDGRGPGREILLNEMVPLLDSVEQFVQFSGGDLIHNSHDGGD